MVGIQGPLYQGTGCFHRRKVIYGPWLDEVEVQGKDVYSGLYICLLC